MAVAALAASQAGVVSASQLRAAGLDARAVSRRAAAGRLHPLSRGVYAVGHTALSPDGRIFAALLGSGEEAAVSHRTAAHLWGIAQDLSPLVDVLSTRGRAARRGVRLHLTRDLPPGDVTRLRGIAVTSVPRTLVDLAAVLDARRLERAVHEAEVLRLLDVAAVAEVLARSNGRRGTGRLRALLAVPAVPTRTEMEARFLDLCRDHRLPEPAVGRIVGGHEVDFLWDPERLIAETDGRAVHDTRRGFEDDRRRDVELAKLGFHVVRFTWRRIVSERRAVAADVSDLLALRAGLLGVPDRSRPAGSNRHTARQV